MYPVKNIILIGDPNQLDPFRGWGKPFSDLIRSEVIPIVRLTKHFRSQIHPGEVNGIILNSKNILEYKPFVFTPNFHHKNGSYQQVINILINLANQGMTYQDVKVLCPYRKDTEFINLKCQEIWSKNTGKSYLQISKEDRLYLGDPVMMIRNNYLIGIMNGESGYVSDLLVKEGRSTGITVNFKGLGKEVNFYFDGEFVEIYRLLDNIRPHKPINPNNLELVIEKIKEFMPIWCLSDNNDLFDNIRDKYNGNKEEIKEGYQALRKLINELVETLDIKSLNLAYAMTVHKSQGSEYPRVIYYVSKNSSRLINNKWVKFVNRKLTYTALTRSKDEVYTIDNINEIEESSRIFPAERKDLFYSHLMDSEK
jgi:ATP-dependent exoDNAse (exonuclease V) alpha subunit